MKKAKREQWIDHFQEVYELMEKHLEYWVNIGEIRKAYDEFVKNLKRLKDLRPDLSKDLSPYASSLIQKRKQLIRKTAPIANVLAVFIQDHPSGKKTAKLVQQRHQLKHLSHTSLIKYSMKIERVLRKRISGSDITRYGLTEGMIMEMNSAIHSLESARKLKKDLFHSQRKMEDRAARLIHDNQKILNKRLDPLLSVFSGTHPGFYKEYRDVRNQIKS